MTNATPQLTCAEQVSRDGCAVVVGLLGAADLGELESMLAALPAENRVRGGSRRNLLRDLPSLVHWCRVGPLRDTIAAILGDGARPVRGILFDKSPGGNWSVGWHQDTSVAVRERRDVDGFTAWSTKHGQLHANPPAAILEQMITARIHLDRADESNGALQVLPATHPGGILEGASIDAAVESAGTEGVTTCGGARGSVVLMRPLLLHASRSATTDAPRRILHIEFAAAQLPGGLEWAVA